MADYVVMLNTIRANQSAQYQDRIPVATAENFSEIGTALLNYEAEKNEFLNAFVYKICYTEVSNRKYSNPWAVLKKGTKPYGGIKEIVHTNPVEGVEFDGANISDMLTVTKPDVKTAYFKRNRQSKYPVSISDAQLKTAFISPAEFGAFHQSVLNAMYSGDEMDEYLLMRKAVSEAISEGKMKVIEIDYAASPAELIKGVQTVSRYFKYESAEYAGYNVQNAAEIEAGTKTPVVTWCPTDKQFLLIREDVDVNTDIEVLAKAFNMDKTNFTQRKLGIDTFDDQDVLCVLCDESMFEFMDDLYKVTTFANGSNLVTNYWLHHWETIGLNPFANAVAFKQKASA